MNISLTRNLISSAVIACLGVSYASSAFAAPDVYSRRAGLGTEPRRFVSVTLNSREETVTFEDCADYTNESAPCALIGQKSYSIQLLRDLRKKLKVEDGLIGGAETAGAVVLGVLATVETAFGVGPVAAVTYATIHADAAAVATGAVVAGAASGATLALPESANPVERWKIASSVNEDVLSDISPVRVGDIGLYIQRLKKFLKYADRFVK